MLIEEALSSLVFILLIISRCCICTTEDINRRFQVVQHHLTLLYFFSCPAIHLISTCRSDRERGFVRAFVKVSLHTATALRHAASINAASTIVFARRLKSANWVLALRICLLTGRCCGQKHLARTRLVRLHFLLPSMNRHSLVH